MNRFFLLFLFFTLSYLKTSLLLGQTIETVGHPYIERFSPEIYGAAEQNWAVLQNKEGLMLFGNNSGLLTFNGNDWDLHQFTGKTIRSLAMNEEGRVFVGSVGDFGYLYNDDKGQLNYSSLVSKAPETARVFGDVWQTHVTPNGVFFHTNIGLYHYTNDTVSVIYPTEGKFHFSFEVRDEIYVREWGKGFFKVVENNLQFIERSEIYAQERVYAVLPYLQNKILFIGRDTGMKLYDGNAFTPFGTKEVNEKVRVGIYNARTLKNRYYALAGATAFFILDTKGNIIHELSSKNDFGIRNPLSSFLDKQDNLWVGNYGNIVRIELFSPYSYISEKEGLPNRITSFIEQNGYLYMGSTEGLFYRKKGTKNPFKRINFTVIGSADQIWEIKNFEDQLLAGSGDYLFTVENDTSYRILQENMLNITDFVQTSYDKKEVLGVNMEGVFKVKLENKKWEYEGKLANIDFSLNQIVEYPKGSFWVNINESYRLFQFQLENSAQEVAEVIHFGKEKGLPEEENNRVFIYQDELLVGTSKGIYHYVPNTNRFQLYTPFQEILGDTPIFELLADTQQQDLWYLTKQQEVGKITWKDGKPNHIVTPYRKFKTKGIDSYSPYLSEFENGLLLGVKGGAIYYNEDRINEKPKSYQVKINQVRIGTDSIFYGGYGGLAELKPLKLEITNNNIHFEYQALFFEEREELQYSYQLVGNEKDWSTWTSSNKKEYTNLWEGEYTFKVKSKNIYGQESELASFSFQVHPPFYRTWLAYFCYVIFIVVSVFTLIKWNTRRLTREKLKLEDVVEERTKALKENQFELQQKQEEVLTQNEELRQTQEELEAQRDFIAERNKDLEFKSGQINQSIVAAQSIQNAFLPSKNIFDKFFQEYFILFKPRDIVSGDFYWASQQGDSLWLAVADCTGHGVPGAFMTLLGKNLLDKLINTTGGKYNPAEVLKQLHQEVRIALRQNETDGKRGMDIILIHIKKAGNDTYQVEYAGAKNSLYVLPPNSHELITYNADRLSIGGENFREVVFTNHTFEVTSDTQFFLATDGYQDQNNVHRKRMTRKRFIKFVSGITSKTLAEQQQDLEKHLATYMEYTDQRDDILVVGLKV